MKYLGYCCFVFALLTWSCQNEENVYYESMIDPVIDYNLLKAEIEIVYENAQNARTRLSEMRRMRKPYDSKVKKEMNRTDSLFKFRMIEILDEYGWVPKDKIGDKAFDALFDGAQRVDLGTVQHFFLDLQKYADMDATVRSYAARMEDRILMRQGKKQIYGSQARLGFTIDGIGEYYIYPIDEPATVNERRKKAGFTNTIESYADSINATYDPGEARFTFPPSQKSQ